MCLWFRRKFSNVTFFHKHVSNKTQHILSVNITMIMVLLTGKQAALYSKSFWPSNLIDLSDYNKSWQHIKLSTRNTALCNCLQWISFMVLLGCFHVRDLGPEPCTVDMSPVLLISVNTVLGCGLRAVCLNSWSRVQLACTYVWSESGVVAAIPQYGSRWPPTLSECVHLQMHAKNHT